MEERLDMKGGMERDVRYKEGSGLVMRWRLEVRYQGESVREV